MSASRLPSDDFETTDAYRAGLVRDRFTPEMLHDDLAALGAPTDPSTIRVAEGVLVREVPGRDPERLPDQPPLPLFSRARWWNRPLPRWMRTSLRRR
ncbi:MAG: hypothetical protein AAGG08_14910 [Actinomycetota bacterium]